MVWVLVPVSRVTGRQTEGSTPAHAEYSASLPMGILGREEGGGSGLAFATAASLTHTHAVRAEVTKAENPLAIGHDDGLDLVLRPGVNLSVLP